MAPFMAGVDMGRHDRPDRAVLVLVLSTKQRGRSMAFHPSDQQIPHPDPGRRAHQRTRRRIDQTEQDTRSDNPHARQERIDGDRGC